MNDFLRLGQIAIGFIYFLQGVIATAVAFNHDLVDNKFNKLCIALWAIGFIGNHILKQSKRISNRSRFLFEIIWSSVIAVGWSAVLDNSYFLLLVIFVQWMTIILFMSKKICDHVLLLHIVFLAVLYFGIRDDVAFRYNLMEFIASVLVLLLVYWISINTMKLLINHEQRTRNQEKSMDNIMKVLEMKCYEAREATKSKSDFLANMSHEIRTPINSVLGMNEMILRECEDPQIRTYATNVKTSGRMLLSLINDILDFSKIESGEMEIVSNTYDLREILANASQLVETRLQGKEVSFVIETNRAMPRQLFGDKNRVQQVLVNILTNAAKYTLEGNITLKTDFVWVSESNQSTIELRFEVRDTGIGIKKEDLEKLFHSFQRVDEKNNRNIEGTGLGLVITKSLLDCMNGRIDVESEYGVGSVFTLYIPQKVIDKTPIGDSEMKKITAKSGRYQESFHAPEAKVLIVDDNRVNIKVIEGLLKKTWVQITAVESGEECLTIVEKEHFDLILMDHLMPGLDGIETLHRMLDNEEQMCRNVPVIALTANAMQGVREMYLENGFSDYLMKPVNSDELEKMLIKYLPGNLVKLL